MADAKLSRREQEADALILSAVGALDASLNQQQQMQKLTEQLWQFGASHLPG